MEGQKQLSNVRIEGFMNERKNGYVNTNYPGRGKGLAFLQKPALIAFARKKQI
jgi:hypothetical protein